MTTQTAGAATGTPLVSVVIPTWNRLPLVLDAVRSALAQTWQPLEVLVVDDGSTDGTVAALQAEFASAIEAGKLQVLAGAHQGASEARNLGVEQAQGEFVAFLDSDDLFLPTKVETAMALFAAEPDLVLVHGAWTQFDLATGAEEVIRPTAEGDARGDLLRFTRIATPTVVVRRDAFLRAGGFRPKMFLVEDYDAWCRTSAQGPVGLLREPLSTVRLHGGNSVRDMETIRRNQRAMINGFFDSCDTSGLTSRGHYLAHADLVMTAHYIDSGRYALALKAGAQALWQGLRADPATFGGLVWQMVLRVGYRLGLGRVLDLVWRGKLALRTLLARLRWGCVLLWRKGLGLARHAWMLAKRAAVYLRDGK